MKYSLHQTRDNRYFKHGIQIHNSMLDFHDVRRWFTETYGVGDDITKAGPLENGHWGFQVHYVVRMIYVKGDEELNWFKLKYGQEIEIE